MNYIGHLDLLRVFQQTVRRSRLPAAYSQGFNPHQLISFALPLPLGMCAANDYAEIYFTEEISENEIIEGLNLHSPVGLEFTLAEPYPVGPGVAACAYAADYIWRAEINGDAVKELLSRETVVIPKKTKSGIKDTDIRGDIYSVAYTPGEVTMRLSAGSSRFLNPVAVAGLLSGGTPQDINAGQFTRYELYKLNQSGGLIRVFEND